jgi:hypothetical protein
MLRKLNVSNKKKNFIERNANIHICDRNCWFMCDLEEVPKLSLMSGLNA